MGPGEGQNPALTTLQSCHSSPELPRCVTAPVQLNPALQRSLVLLNGDFLHSLTFGMTGEGWLCPGSQPALAVLSEGTQSPSGSATP